MSGLVIVSGAIANTFARGGEAWVRLRWILGLRRLGFQVWFLEQIAPGQCVGRGGMATAFEECENLRVFRDVMARFGAATSSVLVCGEGERIDGATRSELVDLVSDADLLVNVSGHLSIDWLLRPIRRKAYVDEDPGFTQFWLAEGRGADTVRRHDVHFTVGGNIGADGCTIPAGGIAWRPLRPFAVLDEWPPSSGGDHSRFTTLASWRGPYGPIEHEGHRYGLKVHEFRKVMGLPGIAPHTFEIALDIDPADAKDRQALVDHGWRIVDPGAAAGDPLAFREYVQASGAEFSVAKGIYVETNSGWFSDRTVCYLASGKPALVQDTGFDRSYAADGGLVPFSTLAEAAEGAARIGSDYDAHSRAARRIAVQHFDSDKVLGEFLDAVYRPERSWIV